ncbi:MAG: DUF4259 domain-containing protein [Kofleriaceae bacterium]|jgi:hypothetical protein|nr:DUF4259 domain-containing protein [Kofleriaceae bacterium]MBP6838220.1 DUF4259 domain-containing protein [Kofleriaceae bacterium]
MGTWAAGPFGNDSALDFVGGVLDHLMQPVHEFLASPEIDETFDPAFAAIALMNGVMERTPSRPWGGDAVVDGAPIRAAMLACFDEQIDSLGPAPGFAAEQRAALVQTLDTFVALLAPPARPG